MGIKENVLLLPVRYNVIDTGNRNFISMKEAMIYGESSKSLCIGDYRLM
jgi:hypothetical protein